MYARTCKGCGNEFETKHFQQRFCVKGCGKRETRNSARHARRLVNDITFIGVDGEGVDRPDGNHEYVMLSVGPRTLWRDGNQLSLRDILSFLYECYTEQPDAAYVGFFLGYDFIQWEKLLPEREARLLLTNTGIAARKSKRRSRANPYPDAVVWEEWEIDIMAGRRFKLRPHVHHRSEYTGLCRNRTCQLDMGSVPHFNPGMVEPEFEDGESSREIPADASTSVAYEGSGISFWKTFSRAHSVGQGREKVKAAGWMYICDTGPFWQTSFLNVIDPKAWDGKPVCTDEEFATVIAGKSDRGNVAAYGDCSYYSDMQRYNVLENDILARVTTRLNQGFMNDRIPIKIPKTDWYGPGRAAQLWMDQLHQLCADPSAIEHNKMKARNPDMGLERANETGLLNADVYMSMPSWFYDAAQASYYGGWFEQFMHGHVGNVWEYDINSAYPFIIASLPCLHTINGHNGRYTQGESNDYPMGESGRGTYTLVYARVCGSSKYIGAMPYRSKHGLISRPNITKGWYWLHELNAAKQAGLIDTTEVEKWVSYTACDCTPPFNPPSIGITQLYQARLDFGKNTPQGKSAKLVYNSAYGKTAQSIGTPKYSNPVYASLITAGCRTLILEAIASHPLKAMAVSMVATDGVYFITPHPSLNLSKTELGMWDETPKNGMTQLMPGVYWDDKTRELLADGGSPKLKSRGVNARDLVKQIERLDYLFALSHQSLAGGGEYEWPEIEFSVGFLLDSAKSALQRNKWDTAGRVTHNAKRRISSNPASKRDPRAYRDDGSHGITRTLPYREHAEIASTPYLQSFGYVSNDEMELVFPGTVGRDGADAMQYFRDIINGI